MSLPLELYGAHTGNCIRVAIALEEAKIPYIVHQLDLKILEQQSPTYLSLNPLGKVPTVVDRNTAGQPFILSQSNAIMLHVADRAQGRLLPRTSEQTRSLALERFFYFVVDVIAPSHAGFFLAREHDLAGQNLLNAQVIERIQFAETFLVSEPYMAGSTFSLADIAALTIAASVQNEISWNTHPRLRQWFETVVNRPAVLRGFGAFGH
jgi:GST-like protein